MSTSSLEHKWYIVRCMSGKESGIKEEIEKESTYSGIQEKIDEIAIPTEKVFTIKKGKKTEMEKKMLPGYIFLYAVYDDDVEQLLKNIPFCWGFLRSKPNLPPVAMNKEEVDRLKSLMGDSKNDVDYDKAIPYRIGEVVKIIDGPFRNFEGAIQEIYAEKMKLKILVSIFGRQTPIEVHFKYIER